MVEHYTAYLSDNTRLIANPGLKMAPGYAVAVMGIDFTLRYFYKVLLDLLPICNQDKGHKIRCFIMEDRGYLVAHPTLIDPKGHAPAEQQHITHKVKGSVIRTVRLRLIPVIMPIVAKY
ncbi:VWFA and cache domain-containing protein 1 [Xenoophorus captivus]|uniref:VWFA and cache domain-containing protein 1 n=1 Tax=Xenoophorus captivus TaxID=1517983 RepID=A0ABV0R3S0_9TELE